MKRRDKVEIMADILDACVHGANKTAIVHKANLNFTIVDPYLEFLAQKGLICIHHKGGTSYETTNSGMVLLERFINIEQTLQE